MRGEGTRDEMTLLVIEHGAEWPAWAGLLRELAPNCAVEAQLPREPYQAFADRLLARLARLREERVSLRGAGFACALRPHRDVARLAQLRRALCEGVVERLRDRARVGESSPGKPKGGGSNAAEQLIIGGGDWRRGFEEARARAELIALWSDLSELVPSRLVSLRFDEGLSSGLYPVSDPRSLSTGTFEG